MKSNKNFGHVLCAIFYTYCYYNFNPSGIFAHEYDVIFCSPQPSLGTSSSNGSHKFLRIKVQIMQLLMFVMD